LILGLLIRIPGGEYIVLIKYHFECNFNLDFHKDWCDSTRILVIYFLQKFVNGKPRRLILGNGHEVSRFKMFNIKVVINTPFRGGFAFSSFDDQKFIKWRYLFYISGGFLSNLILIYIIYRLIWF